MSNSSRTPPVLRSRPVRSLVVLVALLTVFPSGTDSDATFGSGPVSSSVSAESTCARGCRCSQNATIANCSYANLAEVPSFSESTRILVLDWNHISRLGEDLGAVPASARNATVVSSSLELLSLSHNNVSEISESAFRGLRSLHQLRLDNNRIQRLPVSIFADTPSLGAMSLAGNARLDMASVGAALNPARLPILRLLDLSKVDVITVDGRLPDTVFSQLPALEHLMLHDISIENVSADLFSALSSTRLTTLDLTGSSIGEVNDTAFEPLAGCVEQLILDRAIISPRGLDAAFSGLVAGVNNTRLLSLSLKNVFVDDSHDSAVTPHLFRHLITTRLKTLHMDKSYAGLHGKLPGRLLHPLKHLQLLTLSRSGIRSIPSNAFHGLRHLQTLVLRHNHLSCERQSDCAFMTSSNAPLPHLRFLDLADNLLVSSDDMDIGGGAGARFPAEVFPGLVELDLSGNRLTAVVVGALGNLARLQTLRLSDNPLTDIESGALDGLTGLTKLELDRCRRLTHLRAGALAGLSRLRVFSAHDSGLVYLHHAVFAHLGHLEELYLRNNHLGNQGESIEKISVKQSRLRVVDLGSNRLKVFPKALLKNSAHLNALYLDNNHITDCSQIRVLRHADDLEFLDLSENRLVQLEKECFNGLVAGVTVKLAGNPFQCSCETGAGVRWLTAGGGHRPEVVDSASVTCNGPPELAGTHIFQSEGSSSLPGSWKCRWRADAVVGVLVLLGFTVLVIVVVHARQRWLLLRHPRSPSAASSVHNGSISSVTISNSCYGNGSAVGGGGGGCATAPGSGESNARYSPLIEDDVPSTLEAPSGQQVPVASISGSDFPQRPLTIGNGGVQRKQQPTSINSGSGETATSYGDIDNEALLGSHVTEMEETV